MYHQLDRGLERLERGLHGYFPFGGRMNATGQRSLTPQSFSTEEYFTDLEWLEDLTDQFVEEAQDEALPVLARVAARILARPTVQRTGRRLSRPLQQRLTRTTGRTARTLVRRHGRSAIRTLPQIVQRLGQSAARHRVPPQALPQALRRIAGRVAGNPTLVARLSRSGGIRPGTKCTEAEHSRYYANVNRACKTRPFSCKGTDSINEMYAKAAIAGDCATARFAYQRKCFDRSHPGWTDHETARAQARRAARSCWAMARERESDR